MKKIFNIFLLLICSLSLISCDDKSDNKTNTSDDNGIPNDVCYYATTSLEEFVVNETTKMRKINQNDSHLNDLNLNKSYDEYYLSEINLKSSLVIDLVMTNEENKLTHLPTKKYPVQSLTPLTLSVPDVIDEKKAIEASQSGDYYFILLVDKDADIFFDLALIKKEGNADIDYSIYEGEDILPENNISLASNVQDGVILHAWNWSYKTIEDNLDAIKNAGYTTIQVSPAQQPKDYSPQYPLGWAEQWWKLYQPVSFKIANEGWLGTKADLTSLCTKAQEKGIFIIADIVANHMANVDDLTGSNEVYNQVQIYEDELFAGRNGTYFRVGNNATSDSSVASVTQGYLGMPDLITSNEYVQERVISLLKECIDCGIDGFRFDAAKHIETPDDGAYASNFWPNIITAASEYADKELYYYGEILNTPGAGRSYDSYTKYMSFTDNTTGNSIRNAVLSGNASIAAKATYDSNQKANKIVLWAESHDTYANTEQESTNVNIENINKTWALVAARKDATALYFARPNEMGKIGSYAWQNAEVVAINNFHNQFIGCDESLSSSGNFAIVERYNDNNCGAVIVNVNGNACAINLKVNHLNDGTYYDQITGNSFVVKNGMLTGQMGKTGIVVLTKTINDIAPSIIISQTSGIFSDTLNLEFNLSNATSALITINGNSQIITESTTLKIGSGLEDIAEIDLKVTVINDKYRVTKKYSYMKINGVEISDNTYIVKNIPETFLEYKLGVWAWQTGKDGSWIDCEIINGYLVFETNDRDTHFLIAAFPISATIDWNSRCAAQTNDFQIEDTLVYSADNSVWKWK